MSKLRKRVFITFLSIEILFQIISATRFTINQQQTIAQKKAYMQSWFFQKSENIWWNKEMEQHELKYHPFLAWISEPQSTEHITVSEEGIRQTVGNPDSSSDSKQIYIFGGSTVWGYHASDNETIPSYLSLQLNSDHPSYTITNYGQLAYTGNQEVALLSLLLKQGNKPDMVIFYDGWNDVQAAYNNTPNILYENNITDSHNIWIDMIPKPVNTSIFNVHLFTQIEPYIKLIHYPLVITKKYLLNQPAFVKKQFSLPTSDSIKTTEDLFSSTYVRNISFVDALSKQYSFSYAFILQPCFINKKMSDAERTIYYNDTFLRVARRYNSGVRKILLHNKLNVFDATHIFANFSDKPLFTDTIHTTSEANHIIADYIKLIINNEYEL